MAHRVRIVLAILLGPLLAGSRSFAAPVEIKAITPKVALDAPIAPIGVAELPASPADAGPTQLANLHSALAPGVIQTRTADAAAAPAAQASLTPAAPLLAIQNAAKSRDDAPAIDALYDGETLAPGTRIGIIGAGPGGLMAAEELKKLGYRNVTLLERNSEAGGKAHSIAYEGRVYDMGAALTTPTYGEVRKLARRLGVASERPRRRQIAYFSLDSGKRMSYFSAGERLRFVWESAKYAWLYLTRWRGLLKPGLTAAPPETQASVREVFARHGLPVLQKFTLGPGTAFGYGYPEEVPAAYWLKYYRPTEMPWYFSWREFTPGFQELWRKVAASHDVRYGTTIKSIHRGDFVDVTTEKGKLQFDRLIITGPLDDSLSFLDASSEEKELFSRVENYDYRNYLIEMEDLPQVPGLGAYLPENFPKERAGHPMFWYRRYKDSNVAVFYVLAGPSMSDEEIERNIASDMGKLGARLKSVVARRHWKYFPHVSSDSMAAGFHERVQRLQGQHNTFYTGEVLNFSSVKHSMDRAIDLVRQMFPAQKPQMSTAREWAWRPAPAALSRAGNIALGTLGMAISVAALRGVIALATLLHSTPILFAGLTLTLALTSLVGLFFALAFSPRSSATE